MGGESPPTPTRFSRVAVTVCGRSAIGRHRWRMCVILESKGFRSSFVSQNSHGDAGERKPRRLIFKIYSPNLMLRSIFNSEIVLTVRNKLNDLRISRDS